jgi:LmbE family N-acetylglucosaminyl deacetylase
MTSSSASVRTLSAEPSIQSLGVLTSDLEELRGWPRRNALVVGTNPDRQVIASLHKLGFSTAVTGLDEVERVAGIAAPFTFVLLSADVFLDDSSIELVRKIQRYSPSARLILETPLADRDATTIVRALKAGVVDVVDASDAVAFEGALAEGLQVLGRHRERVLAVGAHPDDVEIGCAGTLLDHRLRGDRVSILTLSRGAVGGDRDMRLAEATAAAEAIGAQLIFGDLPDTLIDDGFATIGLIEAVVKALDPTVVYAHSGHDNHQDHRAVSTATASATRGVRRVFAYQSPSATNEYRPTSFVSIDNVLQRKVQLLMMFDSQNGRSYLEPELVVAGSRYWARHLGANARYAEPFEVIRSVGDLRQSDMVTRSAWSGQPEFGLPAYEPFQTFQARIVPSA